LTRLLDDAGIPLLLVGDSLGMMVLGHPDTTKVTVTDVEHHVRAAARAKPFALLAADMPFGSYDTPQDAVATAARLVAAGAEAVKAEGGREILPQIKAIVAQGIPFLAHLGMLPQHILEEGRYRIKGRREEEHAALLADGAAVAEAGAFAVVLELVAPPVAQELTALLRIPTIGIGSGPDCDGQILVTHDLIGLYPWFTPRHIRPRMNAATQITSAARGWMKELSLPSVREPAGSTTGERR
jgi:3-methyl-2-oxobutanoate hydroxymethyltransferase